MLRALLDEANRSQVSVYTVDARGLTTDAIPASQRVSIRQTRLGNAQNIQQRAVREPQEILFNRGREGASHNDMSGQAAGTRRPITGRAADQVKERPGWVRYRAARMAL
jgi:hypothetical protein